LAKIGTKYCGSNYFYSFDVIPIKPHTNELGSV